MDGTGGAEIIDVAAPFLVLLVAVEAAVSCAARRQVYRLNDSIADLSLGAVSQLAKLATAIPLLAGFALIGHYLSLQSLAGVAAIPQRSPFGPEGLDWVALGWWTVIFVLADHQYYWGHRFTHRVNLAWAGHVAHHSSEEYNLVVALRQSGTQTLFTIWF